MTPAPLRRKVFLSVIKADEISAGGILLTEEQKENQVLAVVAFVGPEVTEVAPGQKVVLARYVGASTSLEDTQGRKQPYLVVTPEDIFGVLEDVSNARAS